MLDIAFALIAIVALAPLLLVIVPTLRFTGEGEVFYQQERIGKGGERFFIKKFATMLKDSPNMGAGTITETNDPRILPLGSILRKSKINELPQLINILLGDMSFVGPRPHAEPDLAGVEPSDLEIVLRVRPGLTGVGSLVFRDEESILHDQPSPREFYDTYIAPYKARLEIWSIENFSVRYFFTILILTLLIVLLPRLTGIIWRMFPTLPLPAIPLAAYLQREDR